MRINKRRLLIIIFSTLSFLSFSNAYGCTSFATYDGAAYYGMNFDYPRELKQVYTITDTGKMKVFELSCIIDNNRASISGMNTKGVFSTNQVLVPEGRGQYRKAKTQMYTWQVHRKALHECESSDDIRTFLKKVTVVHSPDISLHNFFADKTGDSFIVEILESGGLSWTERRQKWQVMTNFPNYTMTNKHYSQAKGGGAARYITAHRYLEENRGKISPENGMELLQQAKNKGTNSTTKSSMIFDPAKNQVFLAINTDYDRIYKIDIEAGTIESHRGFSKTHRVRVSESGINEDELVKWE